VELCSQKNVQNDFFYDKEKEDGEYVMDKVEYIGLPCDCIGLDSADDCNHSLMLSDKGVLNYYLNLLNSNTR
jgi:hypothetical protein